MAFDRPTIIGIVPLYDNKRDSLWMVPGYMEGISAVGGIPLMLPLTNEEAQLRQILRRVDGVLFPGGQDIDPAFYQESVSAQCGEVCRRRDEMERNLLRLCRMQRKPALGICRGLQLFNAVLGGTLYQHIPQQLPDACEHHMRPPYHRPVHPVSVEAGSLLFDLLGKTRLQVNSYHHQGVRELSPLLTACAWSPDGLVEAAEDRSQPFFLGVQWHPEWLWETDADSRTLFYSFVQACRTEGNPFGFSREYAIL